MNEDKVNEAIREIKDSFIDIRRLIDEVRADMDDIRQELRSTKKFLDLPNVTRKKDGSSKFKIR
jgi:hypothetical protein